MLFRMKNLIIRGVVDMGIGFAVRVATVILALLSLTAASSSFAQSPTSVSVTWEVKNRFRLFKDEADFQYMARFHGAGDVQAAEIALAADTKGNGWARRVINHLCVDDTGQLQEICSREYSGASPSSQESIREAYLAPASHRIGVKAVGAATNALCTWKFLTNDNDSTAVVKRDQACNDEVFYSAPYGKTTQVQLFVTTHPEDSEPAATTTVKVRDFLIAGLGDSTAAGEGNPDRPVSIADNGFCFLRFLSGESQSYFRPSRAGYSGSRACGSGDEDSVTWSMERAHWMSGGCHRSLYSYQVRVALALAIENPQIAVTYIPLGCTGATIKAGMLGQQEAREIDCDLGTGRTPCSRWIDGQVVSLTRILDKAHQRDATRRLDLVLLTVGANDIDFSGLVANVMIDHSAREFGLFRDAHRVSTVDNARQALNGVLPGDFANLRDSLRHLLGNKLDHVVYVSYGHPALYNNGQPCPTSRQGFDVHPAFKIDGALLKTTSDFVTEEFFRRLKALAICDRGSGCQSDEQDRMTFVDDHQAQFRNHGYCAQADDDPAFDRDCFRADGRSFKTNLELAAENPLVCSRPASAFRAYQQRARWIRTANDSYFAAMTYPTGESKFLQPTDIHDAIWGAASAVYGGAMHPTAQGYAAMADAAMPAARRLLDLPAPK
jgi:lysophospholipase L1-like esterase